LELLERRFNLVHRLLCCACGRVADAGKFAHLPKDYKMPEEFANQRS
jgi:hypothetical protein